MPLASKNIIEKRAGEKLLVGMDFGPWLTDGETLVTINSIIISGASGTVSSTSQTISGSLVNFFIEGGNAGVKYEVDISVTTSLGQILIGEGPLRIIQGPE